MGSSVFRKFSLLLVFGLLLSTGYAEDLANGEALYKANCQACHRVKGKLVGPQLAGVAAKYANDKEWLYAWVKNAQGMINAGDPKAVALYEQYNKQLMQAFPTLQNSDIDDILAYVEAEANPPIVEGPEGPQTPTDPFEANPDFYYALIGLVGLLALIALMLVFITATMVTAVRSKEQAEEFNWGEVWQRFTKMMRSPYVITTIVTLMIVGGLSKTVTEAREIGLHQGYMPEQPIAFSHKLHAGQYEIDCKYCHSGTYKSKSAWIPSLNVCMNCHKYIAEGPSGGEEIAKIYEAVGWDAEEAAYTKEPKNVEWVRIHNIPDHAYFNHAQHVVVGGLECQTCHGPIQEMEVVYQYSNLGMGWCIECHRQEKVKVLGKETDMTVADMGGLNCARCHY
ncbi:MAG: c-type cytochrome [Bacteroidota bacterium]